MVRAAERLQQVFEIPDHRIDLGQAALVIAQLEYPDLDAGRYRGLLDEYARQVGSRLIGRYDPERIIGQLHEFLFEELGFHGNEEDYYNPRNSFLNDVLEQRTGIPITLAVVYLEITRRLGLPFYGVGLPGHFIVKYDDNRQVKFIDPFHGGRLLDQEDCNELVRSHRAEGPESRDFRAVDNRYIIVRMLNNLRGVYHSSMQYRKAVGVMDMILSLLPASAEEIRQRAWLHYKLRNFSHARRDLDTYLMLCPDAEDSAGVREWLNEIHEAIARMN